MKACSQKAITLASTIVADVFMQEMKSTVDLGTRLDKEMHDVVREIGRQALTQIYHAVDAYLIQCYQGPGWKIQAHPTVRFTTILGEVQIPSAYLWHPDHHPGIRPLKDVMGIEGNRFSDAVQRALVDFGSEKSFARAARQFHEHYGWEVGRGTVGNHTERVAEEAEHYLHARLHGETAEATMTGSPPQTIVAEVDGCEIRTGLMMTAREAERDDVPAEQVVRVEAWREVRTGIVRPLDEGHRLYVGRMAGYPEVCQDVFDLARIHGLTAATQVIAPGDGGLGLKEEMTGHFEHFQYILDHRHLESHLYDTADALGVSQEQRQSWVKGYMDQLWENQVATVLQQLTTLYQQTGTDRLRRLIQYITRFEDAVDYGRFRDNGWPVGSGEVESAHRYVPQERLKIAGACWHPETVNPMLALRVIRANSWWDDFWNWRYEQHQHKKHDLTPISKGR
jgi:hypothetical protein